MANSIMLMAADPPAVECIVDWSTLHSRYLVVITPSLHPFRLVTDIVKKDSDESSEDDTDQMPELEDLPLAHAGWLPARGPGSRPMMCDGTFSSSRRLL